MPVDDYDVSKTDDGRILVMTDKFAVSFVNGQWHRKLMFKPEDVREDFMTVENKVEAKKIYDEAVKALKL